MRLFLLTFAIGSVLSGCGGEAAVAPAPASTAPPPTAALAAPRSTAPKRASTPAPKAPIALEDYFKIGRVSGLSFSHDEKLVAYLSDENGRPDLYVKPLLAEGTGAPTQITHASGFVHSYEFSPASDALAFETDVGGDELPHLFLTNAKGDAPRDLVSDLPKGRRTQFVEWAADGKTLLYVANGRDERAMDLYEYDLAKKTSTLLWKSDGKLGFEKASPDHKRFIVSDTHSDADNDLYVVERAKPEEKKLLSKHTGDALYEVDCFSADGRTLFVTSDEQGEYRDLYSIDMATAKSKRLQFGTWDIDAYGLSRDGRYSYAVTNADGAPSVALHDTKSGADLSLPPPPPGSGWDPIDHTRSGPRPVGFSKSGRWFGVMLRSDTLPAAPYVLEVGVGAKAKPGTTLRAIPLADPRPPSLRERAMVTGKSVLVPSFDGKQVPAFLYTPPGNGPFPAVIDVHGGPTGQSKRSFDRFRQYLVSKGYVVLVPNVRGSTGYGKTWTKLDNLDLGGGPLKDIVACKKHMVESANVDPARVVVMGGSYGGYMALAAEAFTPEEFVANVDYFGVSDLKSLVESFPPYWASAASYIYKKFGDPKKPEDAKYQRERSPLYFVDKMKRPLLVVQGEKDARVKADQSERIVAALKKRDVPVHYTLLEGEGHGFTKNENYLKAYRLTDRFLDRYVWGDTSNTID